MKMSRLLAKNYKKASHRDKFHFSSRVELAWAILLSIHLDYNTLAELEALLTFSDDLGIAKGHGEQWWHAAKTILGYAYLELGRIQDAESAFRMAFHWTPTHRPSAEAFAKILSLSGRDAEAIDVHTECRELNALRISQLKQWVPQNGDKSIVGLYLDLLEKVVCNWIYGDPSHISYGTVDYKDDRRAVGRDLPVVAHTMIGRRRLNHFRWAIETVIAEDIEGDILEAGVWRGGACILARGTLAAHDKRDRRIFVADSFSGLPPPDPRFEKDLATLFDFDKRPELAVPVEQVKENFQRYNLLDDQVVFVIGRFNQTLPQLDVKKLAVLRVDGDLYSSTIDVLEALYDRVVRGGFVICDDYGVVLDSQRAVLDFRRKRGITKTMYAIDGDGIYWRK